MKFFQTVYLLYILPVGVPGPEGYVLRGIYDDEDEAAEALAEAKKHRSIGHAKLVETTEVLP